MARIFLALCLAFVSGSALHATSPWLMDSRPPGCVCGPDCPCGSSCPGGPDCLAQTNVLDAWTFTQTQKPSPNTRPYLLYEIARADAVRYNLPLVVGINVIPPANYWCSVQVSSLLGYPSGVVVVALPKNGELYPASTLPATATMNEVVAVVQKGLLSGYTTNYGDCANGNCNVGFQNFGGCSNGSCGTGGYFMNNGFSGGGCANGSCGGGRGRRR